MKHGSRSSSKSPYRTGQSGLLDRQTLIQTLGGVTVLLTVPLLVALAFSPDFHDWVRKLFSQHTSEEKADTVPPQRIRFLLPDTILAIAEVSRVEPDSIPGNLTSTSESSRAFLRLQRTLQAHGGAKTEDILNAANERTSRANGFACPFELISGEQSLRIGKGPNGEISLAATFNRCAEAVERLGVPRRYSGR